MSSARIKEQLEHSSAINVAVVVPAVAEGLGAIDKLHAVAASYSPESAEEIPLGAEAGFWRKLALGLTPLFLAFGWVAFFKAARQLAQASRPGFDLWLKAGASFIAAAGTTLITIFLFTSLAYLAPYFLMAILGLNALTGVYYTARNLYLAYKDKEHRWEHLKEAGKQFLGIVTNTLAMVLNILVFQTAQLVYNGIKEFASDFFSLLLHFDELMNLFNGPVMSAVSNIKGVGLGWLGAFVLGLIVSASKINKQSWQILQGRQPAEPTFEREALNDMGRILEIIRDGKEHPLKRIFFALTAPLVLPLYAATSLVYSVLIRPVAALTVGIPELVLRGLWLAAKCLFCSRRSNSRERQELEAAAPAAVSLSPVPGDSPAYKSRVVSGHPGPETRKTKKKANPAHYSSSHSQFKPGSPSAGTDTGRSFSPRGSSPRDERETGRLRCCGF